MAWELTGNKDTNPTADFVGTTGNQPLAIRTSGAERLRVDTSGKVGIGTANPAYNLHVAGAVGTDIRVEGSTNPRFSINQTGGGVEQKRWQNYATTNALNFSALNDAETSENFLAGGSSRDRHRDLQRGISQWQCWDWDCVSTIDPRSAC
jgi:hypothetical protein